MFRFSQDGPVPVSLFGFSRDGPVSVTSFGFSRPLSPSLCLDSVGTTVSVSLFGFRLLASARAVMHASMQQMYETELEDCKTASGEPKAIGWPSEQPSIQGHQETVTARHEDESNEN